RNSIGHLDILRNTGARTFRGPDLGWFMIARAAGRLAGRTANFVEKKLPIPPTPVNPPQKDEGIGDISGSMLRLCRNGARRFVFPAVTRTKLSKGLVRSRDRKRIFHLWFHPSNFYFRCEEQLATLAWFLEQAADQASRGDLEILTMGECSRRLIGATVQPGRVLQ